MLLIPFIIVFILIYIVVSITTFVILIPMNMSRSVSDFFGNNIGKINFVLTIIICVLFYYFIFK